MNVTGKHTTISDRVTVLRKKLLKMLLEIGYLYTENKAYDKPLKVVTEED